MRLHPWAFAVLGVITSSISVAASHEVHLPYLRSAAVDAQPNSYLSIQWSVANGSLYANHNRVFPPALPMQLHASRFENSAKIPAEEDIPLFFTLNARPLSTNGAGAASSVVRVSVELLDTQSEPVSPYAVTLDLLSNPDGTHHITRIRLVPGQAHPANESADKRPWQMKFWHSQIESVYKQAKNQPGSSVTNDSPHATTDEEPSPSADATPSSSAVSDVADSRAGYFYSPYWVPGAYSHNSHRHSHSDHHRNHAFMRLMRPVIVPAFLGAVAGLVACLIGFVIGHICMSLSRRLGWSPKSSHRRSRILYVEDGTLSEKPLLMPPIIRVTDSDEA